MASGNRGKLAEILRLLEGLDIELLPQSDFGVEPAEETGDSFEANALIKARHAAAATGLPAIADDSGLAVDALDGRPGVYSARYAGPDASDSDNIDKLLGELSGVDGPQRGASFHCVACFVRPEGGNALIAHGQWHGRIAGARRGSGGFGYDPVFIDTGLDLSAAEMDPALKNRRSHRGQALSKLAQLLRSN